jgi:hypothetical protein
MRLSEAIVLGSTVVHPRAGGLRFSRTNEGCALGMAAIAAGCTFSRAPRQIPVKDLRTVNIETVFGPWLIRVVMRPCECQREFPREMRIKDVIAHLFDFHVMEKQNWSVDQLVEWVQRWEPREIDHEIDAKQATPSRTEAKIDEIAWQSTREAFEAKHKSRPRRRPSGIPNNPPA